MATRDDFVRRDSTLEAIESLGPSDMDKVQDHVDDDLLACFLWAAGENAILAANEGPSLTPELERGSILPEPATDGSGVPPLTIPTADPTPAPPANGLGRDSPAEPAKEVKQEGGAGSSAPAAPRAPQAQSATAKAVADAAAATAAAKAAVMGVGAALAGSTEGKDDDDDDDDDDDSDEDGAIGGGVGHKDGRSIMSVDVADGAAAQALLMADNPARMAQQFDPAASAAMHNLQPFYLAQQQAQRMGNTPELLRQHAALQAAQHAALFSQQHHLQTAALLSGAHPLVAQHAAMQAAVQQGLYMPHNMAMSMGQGGNSAYNRTTAAQTAAANAAVDVVAAAPSMTCSQPMEQDHQAGMGPGATGADYQGMAAAGGAHQA